MHRHYFFDLDNTLTRSKSLIAPEHVPILQSLAERAEVIVVSGSSAAVIAKHLTVALAGQYHTLAQNGNLALTRAGALQWERTLTQSQKDAAHAFIAKARAHLAIPVRNERDIVEDRGCQLAYSLIGHNEEIAKKEAFDPDHAIPHALLRELAEDLAVLEAAGIEARRGGTTNIDMFGRGQHKGFNVREYIEAQGWKTEECIYIGDALFPGGNDETVIGVIETHPVGDYRETYRYLESVLRTA